MSRLVNIIGLVALIALLHGSGVAAAQEATPTPGRPVPAPEECTVEPRSSESLRALLMPTAATPETAASAGPSPEAASPEAEDAGPPVLEIPFQAPDGEEVDAETAAAVTAVSWQEYACSNAMDSARQMGLYTDEALRGFPPEFLEAVAAGSSIDIMGQVVPGPPVPLPPAEQTALFAVLDIERLEDGRVGAYVIVDSYLDPIPVEINYAIFRETEEGWKIDNFICFDAEGQYC
jgi:hypothetical protein